MAATPSTQTVPGPHRRLIKLMQVIGFGHIEGLHLKEGQPVFDPPPRVVRDHKFGARGNGPASQAVRDNFLLKQQVCELLEQLEAIGDGVVERLEVQNGLPFRMSFAEPLVG